MSHDGLSTSRLTTSRLSAHAFDRRGPCARRRTSPGGVVTSVITLTALVLATSCGGDDDAAVADYGARVFDVGHRTAVIASPRDDEQLTVEVWYPSDDVPTPASITTFVTDPARQARLQDALDAPAGACVRDRTSARRDASVRSGQYPLLVFSHCLGCMRFSSFSIAEHLASRGFVVVAPDHAGNTWFEVGEESYTGLTAPALERRVEDVRFLIDVMTGGAVAAGDADALDEALLAAVDGERIGVLGHSFGSVTSGHAAVADGRIDAVAGIAAPWGLPTSLDTSRISVPTLLYVAREDNSIAEVGNRLIRSLFASLPEPTIRVELADTGHFGFNDVAGLDSSFAAGCGEGIRQTSGQPFTYLDTAEVISLTAASLAAFFEAHLLADADALPWLTTSFPANDAVALEQRPEP